MDRRKEDTHLKGRLFLLVTVENRRAFLCSRSEEPKIDKETILIFSCLTFLRPERLSTAESPYSSGWLA